MTDLEILNKYASEMKKDGYSLREAIEMLVSASKPALGVKPCWLASEERIGDLADGIKRQIESGKPDLKLIKRWTREIGGQCELIEYDRRNNED